MKPDWWPRLLAHIPTENLWAEPTVPVASLKTFESDPFRPGERRSYTVLVPAAEAPAVAAASAGLAHEVSSSGPHPVAEAAGHYEPSFWVSARDLPHEHFEPFVLAWSSHDRTVLAPDPRFLMTFGLMPRAVAGGKTVYDDPTGPTFDIVEVDAPSVWSAPVRTPAQVRIVRDYVQDYLTLRGAALFEVYYEIRWGEPDEESLEVLGGQPAVELRFPDRVFQLNRQTENGATRLIAQVWGARMIAGPADLPVTADPLERAGLAWPGYPQPITPAAAARLGVGDYAYVSDAVLGAYEGAPGFDVHPESGGVAFGTQWSVGFCDRIGRDTLRLELKKLYEGAPPAAIRHWHRHAILPSPALLRPEAREERNIALRAKEVVLAYAEIGASLHTLAGAVGVAGTTPEAFVGLDIADLRYRGWWAADRVEPIARHAPLDLDRDGFLRRCVALNSLLGEGLGQASLRTLLTTLGVPPKELEKVRGLKLLDYVVRLAQVARTTGYRLPSQAEAIRDELKASGTEPARPLEYLFALYDLRIVGSHAVGDAQRELTERLARFGVEAGDFAGGFGRVLDRIYDALGAELEQVRETLSGVVGGNLG